MLGHVKKHVVVRSLHIIDEQSIQQLGLSIHQLYTYQETSYE